jgi:hypothetical protein
MSKSSVMTAHGLTTKFIPLIFTLVAFLFVSDYLRDSVAFIEPEDAFIGTVLFLGAVIFLYEGLYAIPDSKKSQIGSMGAILFFILVALNGIFGIAVLFDYYDPLTDSGDYNFILQIVLFANIIILLTEGVYEIVLSRRFTLHRAVYQ